jgi:hypothetical protein
VYGSLYYWNFRISSFKQVACLILLQFMFPKWSCELIKIINNKFYFFVMSTCLTYNRSSVESFVERDIARNDRWFAHLHIQNGGSKRIWILTYSWTGNFLLAWAGQLSWEPLKIFSKIFIEERFINNVTGTDRICPGN